ncbi:MAG: pseudouridine-5'-phosphate glycosidase [Aquiluna sp.]|jgi:pseudouridylate synthase|nr:pseudouridine-5'-phosphate glycosidase [Aquiluna sp.]
MSIRQLAVHPEVQSALDSGSAVVALESTIISHGLPYPQNLAAAKEFEAILTDEKVCAATIAVIDGVPTVGLTESQLEQLASKPTFKASVRDLPMLAAKGLTGATTVAATAHIAALAGIRVFATGGLGGVHRGASETFDESADIPTLANTPVVVVSAGVKSILDIRATLERIETLSVPLVGYRTEYFPSFWLPKSPYRLDWKCDSALEVAEVYQAQRSAGSAAALLVANPVPEDQAWDQSEHDEIVGKALAAAVEVEGKSVTPFLLDYIVRASSGRSLEVNLALVRNNVRVAAKIAKEIVGLSR